MNRSAVVVTPKQPFLDWLHSIDPSSQDIKMADLESDVSIYLLPQCDDDREFTRHLKEACQAIFEQELESWDRVEESWPNNRSFEAFQNWFNNSIHSMTFDLSDEPLQREGI